MKFYGDIELNDNELQQMVIETELAFPNNPPVGTVVFKEKRLWMAVALNIVDPIWIPISNTINTYIHEQTQAAVSWSITHNLSTSYQLVQVYDENNKLTIPDNVEIINDNQITITFGTNQIGRAVIIYGDEVPANGVGIIM